MSEEHKSQLFETSLYIVYIKYIFDGPDGKLKRTIIVKHQVNTGDGRPINIPPKCYCMKKNQKPKNIMTNEYSQFNKIAKKDAFSLPSIHESLDALLEPYGFSH